MTARHKPRPVAGDLDKYVPVAELAHSVGVVTEAPADWFRRRKRLYKHGSRNYVTVADADAYLAFWGLERVAKRPKGWKTVKAVLDCGVGDVTLRKAIRAGRVRAVMVGKVTYLEPGDVERFVLEYGSLKPLPGWVLVPVLRDELRRSKEALNQWIRREGVEVRRFLHPTRNRPTPYIREAEADRYRQVVAERGDRHVGLVWKNGEDTHDVVLRAVLAAGTALDPDGIAAATGIVPDTCRRVAQKLCAKGALERHGRGTAHHPYVFAAARLREAA